jgi:hypothetical protein
MERLTIVILIVLVMLIQIGSKCTYEGRLYAVDMSKGDLLVVVRHKLVRIHPNKPEWWLRECWVMTQESKMTREESKKLNLGHFDYVPWVTWYEDYDEVDKVWKLRWLD